MKTRQLLIRGIVLLIVSFVFSVCVINNESYINIENIIDVTYMDNFIYVIDKDKNDFDYSILKISGDSYTHGFIEINGGSISGVKNEKINMANNFIVDDRNNIYLRCIEKSAENGTIASEKIYLCDFKKSRLKLMFSLQPDQDQFSEKNFGFRISDDILYYVTYENNTVSLKYADKNNQFFDVAAYEFDRPDIMFIDFRILDDMTVAAYSSYGGIFIFNEQFPDGRHIYGTDDNDNSIVSFDDDDDGNILFYDVDRDMLVCRGLNGKIKDCSYMNREYRDKEKSKKIRYPQFKKISYSSENEFTAIVSGEGENGETAVLVKSQVLKSFKMIRRGHENIMFGTAVCTSVIFAGCEVLYFVFLFIGRVYGDPSEKRKIKYIPVAVRVIIFTAFVTFASGIILNYKLKNYIIKQIEEQKYESFLNIGQQIQCRMPQESKYSKATEEMRDIIEIQNFEINGKLLAGEYHCLHAFKGNVLYTLINEESYENVPCVYVYPEYIIKHYTGVGIYEKIMQHDSYGDWYIVLYRVNKNSFLEIGIEKYIVDYSTAVAVRKINLYTIMFFCSVFIFFSVITVLYLFPLRRLSKNVTEVDIFNGSKGLEFRTSNVFFFGENEITRIAESLDFMYSSIQRRKYEIERNNKTYQKFICNDIFELIGKKSVTEITPDDYCKFECIILKFDFSDIINEEKTDQILNLIIDSIDRSGGILEYFNSEYVYSFFQSDYENAVKCAIVAVSRVKQYCGARIHAGMSSGEALAAIIGGKIRKEGVIISQHKDIAGSLSKIAATLNCSVIASGSVCSCISWNNGKISKRLIGEISVPGAEVPVPVYEIIDCNSANAMKEKTIRQFEAGLKLLNDMKPDMAKNKFVDVIRENNTDLVAKYYYDKCENKESETII